jgi:hypothetical protein
MTGSLCAESKKAPNEFFASFADIVFIIYNLYIKNSSHYGYLI